ncbi:protein kinase domain-containing protein [Streptomyces sp. NPDC054787]
MKPLETGDPTSVGEGRYRLVGRLGQGGMGVVYLGRSRSGRAVAVKVVRPELSTEPGFKRRFADEVAAARRVGGFHTAPVVDADPDGEPAWLVTAFVPGPTLQAVLAQVGSLPLDTLTVLAAGLAEALQAIHRAGVIHRDLKPANIIVAEDGPRVIDFGIARALDGTALTQTGMQVGTPGFLAPEQLTGGGAVTPAVDMFALGVVLTQAAGGSPFGDGPSAARHYKVVHEEADLAAVPGELREAIGACLSKDPQARPTPTAFLDSLTVRHPAGDCWLPDAATQLLPRVDPGADPVPVPDGPHDVPAPETLLSDDAEPEAGAGAGAGAGPEAGAEPVPVPVPLPVPLPLPGPGPHPGPEGVRQSGDARPRRRRAVAAAALVASLTAVGLLLWQPWNGSAKGDAKSPAAAPSSSAPAPGPAPFPTDPLLIRQDTAPGWPATCHGAVARRDAGAVAPVRLVAGGACDMLPQWSPDRRSFAFTRTTPEGTAVWTARADGSNARRIASIAGGRVSWSPDGSQLAVLRKKDGVQQLFVVDVADGTARQLTSGAGQVEDPAWSPDGKRIAVCLQTAPENWQIHVVDPAAPDRAPQQVTRLPHPALDPVWSPDGATFAYTAGTYGTGTQGDVRLVDADGTDDRELVATAAHEMDPAWSVDGSWVAFVRGPYEKPAIWAVRTDKTGERALTDGASAEGHPSWR